MHRYHNTNVPPYYPVTDMTRTPWTVVGRPTGRARVGEDAMVMEVGCGVAASIAHSHVLLWMQVQVRSARDCDVPM